MGSVTDIATKQTEQQVYACGIKLFEDNEELCNAQGHVLKEDGDVICTGCLKLSMFEWVVGPHTKPSKKIKLLRLKESITLGGQMIRVCGYCSGLHFHFWANGTIHCMRCRKKANAKFNIRNED